MNGPGSPSPFIKNEPDDFSFDPNRFTRTMDAGSYPQQNGHNYAPWQGSSIDPLDISMGGTSMSQSFAPSQSISSGFNVGSSQITDDDLLGSLDTNVANNGDTQNPAMHQNQFQQNHNFNNSFQRPMQPPTSNPSHFNGYSSTPDGAPIQSPFDHGQFDYNQWQPTAAGSAIPHHMSRSMSGSGRQAVHSPMAIANSPLTPMTPGMGNLHIGSPEPANFPGQAIQGQRAQHGHQHSISSNWDNSFGSGYSQFDGPMSSPNSAMHPHQISEVLKSGTPTSHPTPPKGTSKTTAEMKKAKRRASHNEVERRRRNHINDQITALSRLVPAHRLEDDNLRRSLNNSALPHSLANGASSPPATSLLSNGQGRRAVGSISQGLPIEDKDKGPAKGDVLNGSVGWVHDLLWMLYKMICREKQLVEAAGQPAPPLTDEEARMLSELKSAFEKNQVPDTMYSRAHGSNLFVPGHTDPSGSPLPSGSQSSLTPETFKLDFGPQMNGSTNGPHQFWGYPSDHGGLRSSTDLKEEDEFDLELT